MGNITPRLRFYHLALSLSLFLLANPGLSKAEDFQPKVISDFSPGLQTKSDSSAIPDGAAQDLSNVDLYTGQLNKRRGTQLVNGTPLTGDQAVRKGHEYIDTTGTFHLLTVSSNTIWDSTNGGATNSVLSSTFGITSTTRFQTVNAFGNAYFISSTTSAIIVSGSTIRQNNSIPLGSAVAFFAGRLWVANGSTLSGSRVGSDTDWVDDGVDDADAFIATVRSQDGYSITALAPFGPDLLIFKSFSIDRLILNSDGLTFSLVPLISRIGTDFPETVQATDNTIEWLAHDGVYSYDGSQIVRKSELIQPTIANLAQLSAATRNYTENTQANFQAGTSTGVSTSVLPDSVVLSTWTHLDTTGDDFNTGINYIHVTTASSGNLQPLTNEGFERGSTETYTTAVSIGGVQFTTSSFSQTGNYSGFANLATSGSTFNTPALICTGTRGWSYGATGYAPNSGWVTDTSTASVLAGGVPIDGDTCIFELALINNAGTQAIDIDTNQFIYHGLLPHAYYNIFSTGTYIDNYVNTLSSNTTGQYDSAIFDTGITQSFSTTTITYAAGEWVLGVSVRTSTDNVTFGPFSSILPSGSSFSSSRYFQYRVDFSSPTNNGFGLATFNSIQFDNESQSGRYISQAVSMAGGSSFLPFTAHGDSNGGSLIYEIYTDSDTNITIQNGNVVASSFISSQTITSGSVPTLALNNYTRVGSTFSVAMSTLSPELDDFTLSWSEGNSSLFPSSLFWDQDYYIAMAVHSSTENDTVFVNDRNGAWTKYEGFSPATLFKYRANPYAGIANHGNIVRLQADGVYRDFTGSAISAYWISKDFDLGYPVTVKTLLRYYITAKSQTSGNITFSYGIDRGNLTSSTYALDSTSGFFHKFLSPTNLIYSDGIEHRFKLADATLDEPFSILSVTGKWRLQTSP